MDAFLVMGGSFNKQIHATVVSSCIKAVKTAMVRGPRERTVVTDEK